MNKLSSRRLKPTEVKLASIEDLLEAQNKIFVSASQNWEILCDNRDIVQNEIERRCAIEALDRQVAKHLAQEAKECSQS